MSKITTGFWQQCRYKQPPLTFPFFLSKVLNAFVCSHLYILHWSSKNVGEPCGRQDQRTKYAEKILSFRDRGAYVSAKSFPSCDSPNTCLCQYSTRVVVVEVATVETSGHENRRAVLCVLKLSLSLDIYL